MVTGAVGSAAGPAAGGEESGVARWSATRRLYLDNLKVQLIAAIIAHTAGRAASPTSTCGSGRRAWPRSGWGSWPPDRGVTALPDRLYRRSRALTAALIGGLATLLLTVGYLDVVDQMMGGWHLAASGSQ